MITKHQLVLTVNREIEVRTDSYEEDLIDAAIDKATHELVTELEKNGWKVNVESVEESDEDEDFDEDEEDEEDEEE